MTIDVFSVHLDFHFGPKEGFLEKHLLLGKGRRVKEPSEQSGHKGKIFMYYVKLCILIPYLMLGRVPFEFFLHVTNLAYQSDWKLYLLYRKLGGEIHISYYSYFPKY